MRWYFSRNGETVGPVEEAQVVAWVKAGASDAMVRDEAGGPWTPIKSSPFYGFISAPSIPAAPREPLKQAKAGRRDNTTAKTVGVVVILSAGVAGSAVLSDGMWSSHATTPSVPNVSQEPGQVRWSTTNGVDELLKRVDARRDGKLPNVVDARRDEATSARSMGTRCVLRALEHNRVLLFPTEAGLREFLDAEGRGASVEALATIASANGIFIAETGTPCNAIEFNVFSPSKVRVLTGPNIGRVGFTTDVKLE